MDAQELHRRFVAYSKAASDDLDAGLADPPCADRSISEAISSVDEMEFHRFWERISRDDELRQRWLDRLCDGYGKEKARLKAVWESASKARTQRRAPGKSVRKAA